MAWYIQGGNVVMSPTGLIFDDGASSNFNFYISPAGDNNNSGTLVSPWSITALNSKQSTYAGKRVGILPGIYRYGTVGGVKTSLYTLCQALPSGATPSRFALNVNGGTSTPTYLGTSDALGNYSPRTATLDASDPLSGALPSNGYGLIGQGFSGGGGPAQPNCGWVTFDGLSITNCYMNGIGFYPQNQVTSYPYTGSILNVNIRIQNCEVYGITGDGNNNMGGIAVYSCIGAYIGNNRLHDITGTGNQGNVNGIHTFGCRSNIYELNTIYNVPTGIHDKNQGLGNGNSTIRYNFVECITALTSAPAALQDCAGGSAGDTQIVHHNIFYLPSGAQAAPFSDFTVPCPSALQFYNNTCVYGTNAGPGVCPTIFSGNVSVYNNIIVCAIHSTAGVLGVYTTSYVLGNYNVFDDSTHTPAFAYSTSATTSPSNFVSTLGAFQSATGQDANSEVATPTFAGTFGMQNAANYQLTGSVGVGFGHIGGTSGGASVNAGAWDGLVSQIGCSFNSTGPVSFPLAGGVFIAGSVQTSFGNPTFQAQVATLGVAVIGLYPGWTSGGFTYSSAPAAVKAINPSIKLVPYTNIMELESGVGSSGSAYSPIFNAATTMNWFLRTTWPGGSITDADGNAQDGLNQTTFTVAGTGSYAGYANYLAWRAFWSGANEYGTNWDGLYMDNCFSKPRVTADYNQSGSGQTATAATANWQAGYASYIPLIRAKLPSNSLVFANAADWEVVSISPTYNRLWDSGAMESIVGGGSSLENTSWTAMMNLYSITMLNCRTPNYSIFMQDGSVTNYAGMRYGLCSCLLDNAYYYHTNNGSYDTVEAYDELSFNLGAQVAGPNSTPTGTYSNSGLTVWTQGVWRRDFVNGIILVNPRGNGSQTITLETTYYTLRGVQDPTVNNHSPVTSVTLPDTNTAGTGGAGLFLSRTPT